MAKNSKPFSVSSQGMFSLNSKYTLSAFCSTFPADKNPSTNNFALPSIIGISGAFNFINALSIWQPHNAANRCSGVYILVPFDSKVVPRFVSTTRSTSALIFGSPGKSIR